MAESLTTSRQVGFLGGGQMARALATGLVRAGLLDPSRVMVADPSSDAIAAMRHELANIQIAASNQELIAQCDVIVLAVKPQVLPVVIRELSKGMPRRPLVISIVAGVSLEVLSSWLGSRRVVRVMPNTPCLVSKGASGVSRADGVSDEDLNFVLRLLSSVGFVTELPEALMDAVTGVSGSGPAFAYRFMEALTEGGVRLGLSHEVALRLAAHTVRGAAEMVLTQGEDP
ncbi:MAG TPA: pyrroline-5-carboxylate reductase, partial [Pirellulaceae bacterium]